MTARQIDMEERLIRQKQEDDRAAFRRHQEEDRKRLEEERNKTKEELLIKRQEYKEKTKNAVLFSESFNEKKKGSFLLVKMLRDLFIVPIVSNFLTFKHFLFFI